MPARNIYKPREGGHLQNDINHTNPMSLASCHLHRSSSAINGFADDMAAIPDVAKNSFLLKKGLKNSELVGNSDCISNLAKSCNQCGMVLKKEKTGLPVMNCDKQQINVNSKKAEFLVGEIDSDTEQSVADEAPSLVASGVKSRVLFFESKQEVPFGQKVRLSKSMPSLLDESLFKEVEIPVVETEMAPVVEKGADFLHQAEAYQTKIKPSKTNTQTVCTETSPPDQAKSSSLPVKEASILAECTSTPTWSSLYGAEEQQGGMSAGCPFSGKTQLKTVRLKNYVKDSQQNDTLHMKSKETHCTGSRCMGSLMQPYGGGESRPHGVPRPKEEVKEQAILFLREYYAYLKRQDSDDHQKRVKEVLEEVERTGTYELYYDELTFGAKLAWRNASRCIGRIQWNNLKVFDFRSLSTVDEIFDAICEHLEYATNMGNLRSTISIFRERRAEMKDLRIWNSQLIRYAGYEQPDGSVIGDPASVDFTKLCMKLGWKGYGGRFDVLPLLIEVAGEAPRVYEIPKHLVLEVKIKHPEYAWFEELGLQWYALPAVANMKLDIGGVEFPFSPFNGWYMVTEVGARDLGDTARYNMLEPIAKKMNLDTRTPASLWKDRAVTELNQAVLYSFQEAKVTLVDHHTASDSFIKHMENEQKLRGGCPADWVWIVPPSNGSTTEVFHQEMLNYTLKPSYDYQDDAWRHYQFEDEIGLKKLTFKQAVILVKITKILMNDVMMKRKKATVLYATETGKSETFAKTLANLLSRVFDVRIFCMNEYEFDDINKESLLVIVTSTFGNGESPMNGEDFSDKLYKLGKKYASSSGENGLGMNSKLLTSLRFAVFGLGSSAYPNFCAFAHFCRSVLKDLGAKEIHEIGEGDELSGQEDSFKNWAKGAFEASCDAFSIDQSKLSLASDVTNIEKIFDPSSYGFDYEDSQPLDLLSGLSTLHSKELHVVKVLSVKELQAKSSSRSTILVELDKEANESMSFEPGDHIAIYPSNDSEIVDRLIDLLHDAPQPDRPLRIKNISDSSTAWEAVHRLPQHSSLRQALTHFIDITNPPSQEVLRSLAKLATNEDDIKALENLSKDKKAYEEWKIENFPTIIDIAEDFPSLKLNGIDLLMLLPVLQCRYYSISSSPLMYPNQIHTTVAVVRYETQGKTKRVHNGVCSYWMRNLKRGDRVPCYIRKAANFRMPKDTKAPVIMIGPGTGIAPLRSFWQHRQVQRDMEEKSGTDWGSMDLYAGCRRFKEDNIYSEEKQQALNDDTLDHAYLALSREPKLKKTYVQDVLARHAKDVCNKLTTKQGHIYVCGDVAMAADVSRVLCEIFQDQLGFSKEKAREFLKSLKSSGHYHEDIFGVTKIPGPSRKEQN